MRRWIILVLLAAFVASQCWGPPSCRLLASRGQGLSMFVVEVRGRLVDGATEKPVAGLGVCAVQYAFQATDAQTIAAFEWRNASTRAAREGGAAVDEGDRHAIYMRAEEHALTDAEGRFRVKVMVTT